MRCLLGGLDGDRLFRPLLKDEQRHGPDPLFRPGKIRERNSGEQNAIMPG